MQISMLLLGICLKFGLAQHLSGATIKKLAAAARKQVSDTRKGSPARLELGNYVNLNMCCAQCIKY